MAERVARTSSSPSPGINAFRLGEPRYDQSTYRGRLRHFLDIVDPRTLLVGDEKLKSSVKLLEDYKSGVLPPTITDSQLWEAQKIKQAIVHPDTGKKIFMPFRMSGYVPFGTVTVVGLLLPNPSTASVVLWQALNQSHNAGVNFANRNASTPVTNADLATSYLAATGTASGVGFLLHRIVNSARFADIAKGGPLIARFCPFIAVAFANQVNVLCMRSSELRSGVDVCEENGRVVGQSSVCARKAVTSTMLTRMLLPAPILLLPPLILSRLEKTSLWNRFPRVRFPIHVGVCMGAFALALPLTIAIFPQTLEIATADCETEIRLGTREEVLHFSRGI